MMARYRTLWTGILVLFTAGVLTHVQPFTHLSSNLCKWCESSSPVCDQHVCVTNCSLSSFCTAIEEICIAIWRKTNNTMTVHTLCHLPTLPLEGVDPGLLLNFTSRECHMISAEGGAMMICGCQGEHECNDRLIFNKGANGFFKLQSKDVIPVVVVSLVPPLLVAIVATGAFYFYRTHQPHKPGAPARPDWTTKRTPDLYQALDENNGGGGARVEVGGGGVGEESNTKGLSLDRDIISDITNWRGKLSEPLPVRLEALVGKGRFAEVWRGRLLKGKRGGAKSDDTVAVKVFPAVEYASWRNECFIFSDPKLEHENVVRFLAAEERGPPGHAHRKYWLVLAYHSLGNLQDFLTANTLSWAELVAMAGSVAKGLAHLHSDRTPSGVHKVPVAHRDLKSSNIVVKSRTECALCDFGLALRLDVSLTVDDYANSGQVGTARYMAPEVLESRVNLEDLEAFKQMDVYSMSLVLWEMSSRCLAIGKVESYEPAFGSKVCEQPCVDSMRDLVLRDRGRPEIPSAWTQHQGMSTFCSTITECWDHDPEARLTAHCVVERFNVLQEEEPQEEEEPRADAVRAEDEETPKDSDMSHIDTAASSPSSSSLQVPRPNSTEESRDPPDHTCPQTHLTSDSSVL
uniref:TGF-beta receptor type-2 isoform X2 n=1 Tax=Solea senegalensis TaxID=28829 RepID=UPI001CD87021|nr:TGF-beta receptor type-2 isoform X2 [Solea senegalensis]